MKNNMEYLMTNAALAAVAILLGGLVAVHILRVVLPHIQHALAVMP